ncbi:MAG: DNA-binding protein [Candidatus Omnitrophica bacterium]|nr:DNA-binding protein [Candidatus Omnitrophota bacterium]
MKNKFKPFLIILLFILIFGPQAAFSQGLSSSELLKNAKQYDGKLITYSGEVIGDVMFRGEFAWVNINDGDNAIGAWMSGILAKEINFTGTYKSRGDTLEVTGIFHRACLEHGGDLDIHVQTLRKLAGGKMVNQKTDFLKVKLILILCGALFLIWILTLFKRK